MVFINHLISGGGTTLYQLRHSECEASEHPSWILIPKMIPISFSMKSYCDLL